MPISSHRSWNCRRPSDQYTIDLPLYPIPDTPLFGGSCEYVSEDSEISISHDSCSTATRTKLGCKVTFGPGASVEAIVTAFESPCIVVSNLPRGTIQSEVIELAEHYGDLRSVILDNPLTAMQPTLSARVEYVEPLRAALALSQLDGKKLNSHRLATKLDLRAVEEGAATLRSTKVKISCFAPTLIAWAHYSYLSFARKRAEELNGRAFDGRKIHTSFQTPSWNQTKSFSVEIKGLPLNPSSDHLRKFCHAKTVTLGKPSFVTTACVQEIRRLLETHGPLDAFEFVPYDGEKPKLAMFAQFNTAEAAENAVHTLNGTPHGFIRGSQLWLELIHSIKYTIPSLQFTTLKGSIDALRDSTQMCRLRYYETDENGNLLDLICIRVYGAEPRALGRLKVRLEHLLRGKLLSADGKGTWDEYFVTPEGKEFLNTISRDSRIFVKCDSRTRTVHLCGDEGNREYAKTLIFGKLAETRSRKHVLQLDRDIFRHLLLGGLKNIQTSLGEKLALNVVERTLTCNLSSRTLPVLCAFAPSLLPSCSTADTPIAEHVCNISYKRWLSQLAVLVRRSVWLRYATTTARLEAAMRGYHSRSSETFCHLLPRTSSWKPYSSRISTHDRKSFIIARHRIVKLCIGPAGKVPSFDAPPALRVSAQRAM
ncbi:hypothetical protein A0H81_06101 [Grifola frondosa]|uniref:RRM domain-containing protein n=1 Tax=Grifola frondosa TaxID=5627 RepID=A0A1C7MAF5_GRIFR|nr:hypothetical protein A0H81_06101 [Grifola frondosa]